MKYLTIREPIWKDRSISIDDRYCVNDWIEIEISFTTKDGNRPYPDSYYVHGLDLKKYPIKFIREGVKLRNIPISDLKRKPVNENCLNF